MQHSEPAQGSANGVPFTVRPERFAGGEWWRVYVDGNPRVLLRYREFAVRVAEVLAADEAQFRRASRAGVQTGDAAAAASAPDEAPPPETRRSWRRQR